MQKITPFLWFDNQAEEAVNFYTSIFKDSKIGNVSRYGEHGPGPAGQVMVMGFTLNGMEFTALNGGPIYKFNESISFMVHCDGQAEVDYYWDNLVDGGQEIQCGWLKDKFGLCWQIVPTRFFEMMSDGDAGQQERVMGAMMQMVKFDVAKLEVAYAG